MHKAGITMSKILKLRGNNFDCFPLEWDTDYFGVKSARVVLNGEISKDDQHSIMEYARNFEFITISNAGNVKENNYWIGRHSEAFLTDMNIQFIKEITKAPEYTDEQAEVKNSYPRDEQIVHIAKSAFKYSRFFNDPKLPGHRAENIYLHWTECAFGQDNKYFVIVRRNNEVAGYILFSINNTENYAVIELIAVDYRYQGQRIGKSLISEMESFIYNKGIKNIKVGTQSDNISAMQFYAACGFKYVSCSSVYHLWNE